MTPTALPPPPPPAPPPAPAVPPAPAPSRPPSERPSWPAITWMAATGGSLLLVAAVIFTVTNWATIPAGVKLGAMVTVAAAVVVAGERSVRHLPLVARVLQHLGAMLVAVAAASLGIGLGADWPETTLAAGLAGLAALTWQLGRRPAPALEAAVPVAATLALAGVAGRTGMPLPLLLALSALGAVAARADRLAGRLAVLAGLTPLGVGASLLPIGAGTAIRLGLRGDVVAWSGPLAGLAAGMALAVVATRRQSVGHGLAAFGAVVAGAFVGLDALAPHPTVWWVVAAATVLALEVVAVVTRRDPFWPRLTRPLGDAGELVLLLAGIGAAIHAAGLALLHTIDWAPSSDTTLALAWTVAGLGALAARLRPNDARMLDDATLHVVAGLAALAAAAVAAVPAGVIAVAAVTVLGVAVLGADRAPGRAVLAAVVAVLAAWVGLVVDDLPWRAPLQATVGMAVAGLLVVGAHRFRHGALPLVAAVLALPAGLALSPPWSLTASIALAVVVAVTAELLVVPRRDLAWIAPGSVVALRLAVASPDVATVVSVWIGLAGLAIAAVAADRPVLVRTSWGWRSHLTMALLPAGVLVSFAVAGVTAPAAAVVLTVAVVPLAGLAFTASRVTPLDTLAVSTAGWALWRAAAVPSDGADARVTGLALVVAGGLAWLYGRARAELWLRLVGLAGVGLGLFALAKGFEIDRALLRLGAPYGLTTNDLAVATLSLALLAGGAALAGRRGAIAGPAGYDASTPPSSWLTAGPGLGLAGWHLCVQLAVTGEGWRAAVALAVGAAAVGWGGARRLAAPLLLGTAILAATIVIGLRDSLTDLPVWVWLAVGGAALLGLAVLVERRNDRENLDEAAAATGEAVEGSRRRALFAILDDYR